MPSEKVLEAKKALVAELAERLKASVSGIVVNYEGISVSDDTACDLSSTKIKELLGFLKKIKGVENGEILVITDVFDDYIEVKVRTKTSKDYSVKKNFKFKEYKGSNMTGEHETKAYNLKYRTYLLKFL